MKYILKLTITITLLFSTSLFANYSYTDGNSGKIDMHGGKGDSLLTKKNNFSNMNMNPLGNIGIAKPQMPSKPSTLIKDEKKTTKETVK